MKTNILYLTRKLFLILLMLPFAVNAQDKSDFEKQEFIRNQDTLKYRILYPADFSEEKEYPVLLFLHGAGERGSDNEKQLVHGGDLFLNSENRKKFPAIVIFPQVPKEDYWANVDVKRDETPFGLDFHQEAEPTTSLELTMELLDSITAQAFVDKSRIYVGGLSMGGMGTYEILARKPETFAAAFAICGAGSEELTGKYRKGFPIWIFHGEKDDIVSPEYSKTMARLINHQGGNAKLSLYPNANHNSWDSAFSEPYLLPWLFSNSKN